MKYQIGQVLYVLMNREMKICPVQVIEEITKRSINGETTQYIVKVNKEGQTTTLSSMDGEIFDSIDVLKQSLRDKITKSVDSIINNTIKRAQLWYPRQESKIVTENIIDNEQIVSYENETQVITLSDGIVARLKSPLSEV